MEHSEVQQLLPAYVDDELAILESLAVERHLESCPACRDEVAQQRRVAARVGGGARYFDAPLTVREHIFAALPAIRPSRARTASLQTWWRQAAAAAMMAAALAWGVNAYYGTLLAQREATQELVANHVRSLQVEHLTDVSSSDQHTVKPWFIGKLNFAPPVVDLASQGFPLVGGRLDYVAGHDVAVLVYRRNRHPINLYVWPGADLPGTPQATAMHGYHLLRWSSGGMNFSAISDVSDSDLAQFVQALRK